MYKLSLIALFSIFVLACASGDPAPASDQPTATEKPAAQGTSVRVGADGVEVRTGDAAVKVTQDSASIDLPK